MKILKLVITYLLGTMALSFALFAQTSASPSTSVTTSSTVGPILSIPSLPIVSTGNRDRLALLVTRRSLIEAQSKLLQSDYQKQMDQLKNDYQKATDEMNTKVDAIFSELGLDKSKFDINLDTGQVVPIKPDDKK